MSVKFFKLPNGDVIQMLTIQNLIGLGDGRYVLEYANGFEFTTYTFKCEKTRDFLYDLFEKANEKSTSEV